MLKVVLGEVEVVIEAVSTVPDAAVSGEDPAAVLAGTEFGARCRPALVRWRGRSLRYVAVWPERAVLGPADPPPDLAGVVLAQVVRGWRCRVCGRRVTAVVPEGALPFFGGNLKPHRWAANCPHCAAHVDRARMHALCLLPERPDA
ncbi:hypothetical protein [Marinactinospora rubrisoli]|uniref:Uncharacterized protein n=1 Tax=Marinactinospora rubrisoli TaxID=2715399 RepID=A0ABW2KEZ2_9ACTN